MKNLKNLYILSLLALSLGASNSGMAQDASWGVGLLRMDYEIEDLKVYDAPNGNVKGSLGMEAFGGRPELTYRENGPSLIIPETAWRKINMDEYGLTVFKEEDGFIQLFAEDAEDRIWVSLVEIAQTKFQYQAWIDFMTKSEHVFYTIGYGMNVRMEPSATATRITTAKGDHFSIHPTGTSNGIWAEVIILEYDSDYCDEKRNLVKESRGYMKILDDAGFPNVWFGGYCC